MSNQNNASTILISAYAVHPNKGSEDGMGWRFLLEAARRHRVIAITRENNAPAIADFLKKNDFEGRENLQFEYFDLPKWARFWKRGGRFSSLYHSIWHAALPSFVRQRGLEFDLAHHLNFHSDWTASHLWRLGKPFVWGPIGHHAAMPSDYLLETGGWKSLIFDRLKFFGKTLAWRFDPFLAMTKKRASTIFGMNSSVAGALRLPENRVQRMPSVGTDLVDFFEKKAENADFTVLFAGRFVALKGVETVVRAFEIFYKNCPVEHQNTVKLKLLGKGELRPKLEKMVAERGIGHATEFIDWLPHAEIGRLYRSASVFFFPSHEGAGMVVAEALAHGLPVFCYKNDGPGELTDDSCAVRLDYSTHENAVRDFAHELENLRRDPVRCAKMATEARLFVEKNLAWSVKEPALAAAWSRALDKKPTFSKLNAEFILAS
jgi:glycosyltransferase involved in cell wall biosynthesis